MKQFSVLASVAQASKSAYMITKNESLIYIYILPIADFWKQSMRLSTLYFMRVLELYFMHYFPNCFFNLQCTAMHPSTITLGIFQLQIFAPIIYGYTVFSLKSLLSLGSESIWFTVENIKWLWTTLYIYAHFVIYVYHIYLSKCTINPPRIIIASKQNKIWSAHAWFSVKMSQLNSNVYLFQKRNLDPIKYCLTLIVGLT